MAEIFNIKGKFVKYEEKKISETFTVRQAFFLIDNTNGDKGKVEETPFDVFGRGLEEVQKLSAGQEAAIGFKIGGWKGYGKITAINITPMGSGNGSRYEV